MKASISPAQAAATEKPPHVISPGAVATELLEHISEKEIQAQTEQFVSQIAIPADSFARMVAFAVNEPENVDVNEILFRPTAQPV
jgi:NADP-dependent 3-hydroxy acid dehydrogenase YdfG